VVSVEAASIAGGGFFAARGLVITNHHVVAGSSRVTVRISSGQTFPAAVSVASNDFDVAILRLDDTSLDNPVLPLGSVDDVRVGQEVVAVGSPLGLDSSVTRGIISALRTVGQVTLVQTDAAINPGNSGGPLLDRTGRVIGINTLKVNGAIAQSIGFAVAIDHAKALLDGRAQPARSAPPSSADRRLDSILNPPRKSTQDGLREQGNQEFEAAVRELAGRAREVDSLWNRYQAGCFRVGSYQAPHGRNWFRVWGAPVDINDDSLGECRALLAEVYRMAEEIKRDMEQAEEQARRAGVYPGVRRDIRRKYGMDWSGWSG